MLKINKSKNMKKNMIFGVTYRIVSMIFPFIIRTVTINVLGSEYLGLSSLFTSILQALNLMELGIGSALVFNMYKPVAEKDYDKINQYMNYYKRCYRKIGVFILIVGLALLPFLDKLITGSYPSDINIYILYIIYLINTVLTYCLFSYKNSIALAYQRTDIENRILTFNQLIMYAIQIIVLLICKNYYLYVIMLPIFTIVKNIMVSLKIDKEYKFVKENQTKDSKNDITIEEKNGIMKNIKALFGHQVAFTVINSADNIMISYFLGLNDLAIYNNYYYILNAIVNLLTIIFSSIQAGIGNSLIIDSDEKKYTDYKCFRQLIFIIVTVCANCLFCLYQPFMSVWMGEELMLSNICMLIFVFGFYVTQIRRVITTYKNAAGMWNEDFYKPYIVIMVDILLDVILLPRFGSIGAMIATILSMGLIAIPWETHVIFKKMFHRNEIKQYLFVLKEFVILILILISSYFLCKLIDFNAYINIICYGIIAVLDSVIIEVIFHFKTKEFDWIINKARYIMKIK